MVVDNKNIFGDLESNLNIAKLKSESQSDSPWLSNRGIKLNVVGPITDTTNNINLTSNKILKEVINSLGKNSDVISNITGENFSDHFSNIVVHQYSTDNDIYTYIPALFKYAFFDEESLNAIIESTSLTKESAGDNAEIGFYLDPNAWNSKQISLSGYKTIKIQGKARNSSWFRLNKKIPEDTNVNDVRKLLANMVVYAMLSPIREYASIDRAKVMEYSDFEFIVERYNGDTFAYIYQDRKKQLEQEKKRKIESLEKEKIILNTEGVLDIDINEDRDALLIFKKTGFLYEVEFISIINSNLRKKIFEVNSWDENVINAYYLLSGDFVIVTDKTIYVFDHITGKLNGKVDLNTTIIKSKINFERNRLYLITNEGIEIFSLDNGLLESIKKIPGYNNIALGKQKKEVYILNGNGNLEIVHSKSYRIEKLNNFNGYNYLESCYSGDGLALYGKNTLKVLSIPNGNIISEQIFNKNIKAMDCNVKDNKLLIIYDDGSIEQFKLDLSESPKISINMNYSGFDQNNSGYIAKYLANGEFIYGGRDDLRIRSSTNKEDIEEYYKVLENKIVESSNWLDQSGSQQAIYLSNDQTKEKQLYERIFGDSVDVNNVLTNDFLVEESIDPILLSNQIRGFNELGLNLQLGSENGIKIVQETLSSSKNVMSVSKPNLEALGYNVNIASLGKHGYDPGIYESYSISNLLNKTSNVILTDDGDSLILLKSDGSIVVKNLNTKDEYLFELSEDPIVASAINKKNDRLIVSTKNGILRLYSIR